MRLKARTVLYPTTIGRQTGLPVRPQKVCIMPATTERTPAIELKCFAVYPQSKCNEPVFVSVHLRSGTAFEAAKNYLKRWNVVTGTGTAVLRRGRAELYVPNR